MTTPWTVPTTAVSVELKLQGREVQRVSLFVPELRPSDSVRVGLLQSLDSPPPFLPVLDPAEKLPVLVRKSFALWVRLRGPDAGRRAGSSGQDPLGADELFDEQRRVRLELRGAESVEGKLLYSPSRAGRARLSDHLNHEGAFLSLWTNEHLYLLNKRFILRAVELPDTHRSLRAV